MNNDLIALIHTPFQPGAKAFTRLEHGVEEIATV